MCNTVSSDSESILIYDETEPMQYQVLHRDKSEQVIAIRSDKDSDVNSRILVHKLVHIFTDEVILKIANNKSPRMSKIP